jgi:hypothetical protein
MSGAKGPWRNRGKIRRAGGSRRRCADVPGSMCVKSENDDVCGVEREIQRWRRAARRDLR